MTTTSPSRLVALLLDELDDVQQLMRQATDALELARPQGLDVHALCVTRTHHPDLAERLQRLPLGKIVCIAVADLRDPVQAADFTSVLMRALEAQALDSGDCVCAPAGALGEEVAARLAAAFNGCALGRVQGVSLDANGVHADRAVFGGRSTVRVRSERGPWFAALRTSGAGSAPVAPATPGLPEWQEASSGPHDADEIVLVAGDAARMPVETARVVVSGGRGMQGPEGFELLAQLASRLDAALGGSLPAVDAGWVPVTHQVGQSGKFVSPAIYLAVGISGTPQHLAGVSATTRIVAINSDEEADIFRVADVGIVADWGEFLPALIARVDASRNARADAREASR
ncbi:electron transfer flavoprotein subunit alpha/FixB family protein [Paraburkholderia unamae]|uniref:Electron transfer flavoprotein alpha subunit apoprotein n=1 Tax=Paraburkholderia unamae TaxID=219649 RepID=A0ABX5KF16_9BURK|nr:electron transfer flavoprotein subunit alpha/FixB family protein [Paraburkholderia unamae]PVX76965.1 electron transfer flavoprotein alpha subunit apoprotein [Paraburkholderia unamae]